MARYVHDTEHMYSFTLSNFGNILPDIKKAVALHDKNIQYLAEGKIKQETFDKYQNVVKNVLRYVNISLDSGSDT